jgi:D-alanine-D-alanine ligase
VSTDEALRERVRELRRHYGRAILAEEFIAGREVSVGVWGNERPEALPPCEFRFEDDDPLRRFRSFEKKWLEGQEVMVPATDLAPAVLDEMSRAAVLAHRQLRCRDYSRADFRVRDDGRVYFLEHNYNPGIGPNTNGLSNTFTRMAEFAGLAFGKMLDELLSIATARHGAPSCR